MIYVKNLTKKFHHKTAVRDVSFEVKRGEIVGFLGPNGAGKTTTLRILSGYMTPTSGTVLIAGHDILTESLEARRQIGYVPENVRLYPELRIDEYLILRARLKDVPAAKQRKQLLHVKELCGLEDDGRRIIGHLSRGYLQRIALADALINDPGILILDEPTSGLDPAKIHQIRLLIKELGRNHTIILSTHILAEVEMICQRVLIINDGKIVSADTPDRLRQKLVASYKISFEIKGQQPGAKEKVLALPEAKNVRSYYNDGWLRLELESAHDLRQKIYALACQEKWILRELALDKQPLEELFLQLIKK